MPYFKKRFYEQSILKAQKDYQCFLTNVPISKGEYYLLIKVQSEPKRRGDVIDYYPTFPIRLSTACLGVWTFEEILEKVVSPMEDDSTKVKELELKVKKLEDANKELSNKNAELVRYNKYLIDDNIKTVNAYYYEKFKDLKECERNYIIRFFKNGEW